MPVRMRLAANGAARNPTANALLTPGTTPAALHGAGVQLGLPLDRFGGYRLDSALDEVRERFGVNALRRPAHHAARNWHLQSDE